MRGSQELGERQGDQSPAAAQWVKNPSVQFDGLISTRNLGLDDQPSARYTCSKHRRGVVAFVGLVALFALGALVVILVVGSPTSSFSAPETFSADFVTRSRVNASVFVKGSIHKVTNPDGSWALSGTATVTTHGSQVTTVTLVDSRAYVEVHRASDSAHVSQRCMGDDNLPEIGDLAPAVNSASEVSVRVLASDAKLGGCEEQTKFAFTYEGTSFLVCMNAGAHTAQVLGPDYVTTLANLNLAPGPSPFVTPTNASSGTPLSCPVASPSRRRRLFGSGGRRHCRDYPPCSRDDGDRRLLSESAPKPSPVSVRRRLPDSGGSWFVTDNAVVGLSSTGCVFVHGAGVTGGDFLPTSYWGDVTTALSPGCRKFVFVQAPTATQRWDSTAVVASVCNAMNDVWKDSSINRVALFAHGSGNLMVAKATEACPDKFKWKNMAWMELQPSYSIGRIAEFGTMFCSQIVSDTQGWGQALQKDFHLCDGSALSTGWEGLDYTSASITQHYADIILEHVVGSMCGSDAAGLMGSAYVDVISSEFAPSSIVASSIKWSRCWTDSTLLLPTWTQLNYRAMVNFIDVTCRNGDGTWGDDRMPCQWMVNIVEASSWPTVAE